MIVYKDIIKKFKEAGYSTLRIRREKILSQSVIHRINNNEPITTVTIDKICSILKCDVEDIIEFREK